MCEVAVWDKTLNCFHLDGRVKLENGVLEPIGKDYTVHQYIGLKDIDDKKIYADSSIVEMDYLYLNCKIKGYFFFSEITLGYHIRTLDGFDGRTFKYDFEAMSNIKIIDTIQENKLNLIKEIKYEKADYVGFVSQ